MDTKISPQGMLIYWMGPTICLVLGATLFGAGFWFGQRSPVASKLERTANGPHSSWAAGTVTSATHSAIPLSSPPLPINVSPEMKEFLQNRATLNAKMEQSRLTSGGAMNPQAFAQFQKDNADLLKRQKELSQIIAQQQAKNPINLPRPVQIPPNASPQLKTYLTARDRLMRDQITFMNKHVEDDPAQRQRAIKEWREQNATRFAQVQRDEKALAQNTSISNTNAPTASPPVAPSSPQPPATTK